MAPMVRFTTDDLLKIGPGQVMVAVDFDHTEIVSRESFIRSRCGEHPGGGGSVPPYSNG